MGQLLRLIWPLGVLLCLAVAHGHDDTWAVIVSSSRFWLNYRHATNALRMYESIKRLGVPDSRIILLIADCSGCDPRNPQPGHVLATPGGPAVGAAPTAAATPQVDYRNRDVSVESVLQVLTGHHPKGTPPSRRMDSTRNSSVLLYLTGHGGDGFLKFHDQNELLSSDLASAVQHMHTSERYGQLMIMLDTCQAATMYSEITAPGWVGLASSKLGQSSYALHNDASVGAHLIDEFSHHVSDYLDSLPVRGSQVSIEDMLRFVKGRKMSSVVDVDVGHFWGKTVKDISVMDFFGSGGGSAIDSSTGSGSGGTAKYGTGRYSSGGAYGGRVERQDVPGAVCSEREGEGEEERPVGTRAELHTVLLNAAGTLT